MEVTLDRQNAQTQEHYFVYIVRCVDESLYTGIAKDITKRVLEHNSSSKAAKYTRARRPVELVYSEVCEDKSRALQREYSIKKLSRLQKEALLEK
ncbi:MAG: GIY-YIG nuclease family protein [Sulfurimonas sp.]|nr:GIY-YIG nuclease family protein [Sulfurimonas sp.]